MRVLLVLALLAATPAAAQSILQAPLNERAIVDSNRLMRQQEHSLQRQQQTQFEINQLRGEIQRAQQFPSIIGPGVNPGCPPGSVGC